MKLLIGCVLIGLMGLVAMFELDLRVEWWLRERRKRRAHGGYLR